tara:strand:+ start:2613 stop:3038 length:426 start_codon:yes stop_codon:yes gene_type:complete
MQGKADQEMFMQMFNHKYKQQLIEYPSKFAPIDFIMVDGKDVIGFVEYKHRQIKSDQYEYIVIDHNKMKKLREHKEGSNQSSYLVITYLDGTFVYEVTGQVFEIEYGGRTTKTRNQYDIKVVEKIPSTKFKHINNVFKENQ